MNPGGKRNKPPDKPGFTAAAQVTDTQLSLLTASRTSDPPGAQHLCGLDGFLEESTFGP